MNSLQQPAIAAQLCELHAEALKDDVRWAERKAAQAGRSKSNEPDPLIRMGDLYIPVSPQEGELLYLLARARGAKVIVEFGASYGISTLYLAAAARDIGGHVFTTEVHPKKCAALHKTFAQAEVQPEVTLFEGDALETLKDFEHQIDMLFLDGWKSLYLPLFQLLQPKLATNALIAADNITFQETQVYLDEIRRIDSGFVSHTIGDMELSCKTA